MIHNLLRSGYTFTENEYELEIKYIMGIAALAFSAIFLLIMTVMFYIMEDLINASMHFIGFILSIVAIYIHRVVGKNNYSIVVYSMAILFFILIAYGYYLSPTIQPISAWIVIQILSSFLVLNITLAVWVTISFSSFMMWIGMFTEQTLGYVLLQVAPAILGLFFVYIVNKKFQMTISLLEKSNNLLEKRVEDRTKELEMDKERLDYQAHYDELTGLPNRLFLKKELRKRLKDENVLSIFVIDLDRFKNVNDIYGHLIGDKILKIIATRINKVKGEEEFLARMSGDEFILITHLHGLNKQEEIASKIIEIVERAIYIESKTIYISASVGICYKKDKLKAMEEMIAFADIAMFEAKKEGRGGFKFYADSMMRDMENKVKLESEMKQAFKDDAFVLHYQPQVDIVDNTISAIEVLVRWKHPQKGLIYPNEFIGIAEEIDLIVTLDYHVLHKGMYQIVQWLKEGYNIPRISFNISGQHLQKDFYLYIEALLETTGCNAKYIELEITEGYLISDISAAMILLEKLQALGIHIAIDDFGKGYSSLAYLKSLPINKIKIDKSFIDNVHTNKVDATIVKSVINIADSLNISVVSEGVETEAQKEYLYRESCRYIQGYYYYKPMDVKKLEKEVLQKVSKSL